MDAIKGMLASSCTVIRDGAEMRIDPKLLVPGDIVRLGLGDRVPADMRIIYTADLKTARAHRPRLRLRCVFRQVARRHATATPERKEGSRSRSRERPG